MPTAVKEEVFEITRDIVTNEYNIAVSTGEGMQVIWDYVVPVGQSIVFRHEDHFAAYMATAGPTELTTLSSLIDVVVSDSSKVAIRPILNAIRYNQARGSATTFLAFSDEDYYNHLDITPGDVIIAKEGERVLVRGNINTALVAASSYFSLTCNRIRHTLF